MEAYVFAFMWKIKYRLTASYWASVGTNYNMKKNCLLFALFLLSLASWAYDVKVGNVCFNILTSTTAEVASGDYHGDVVIPPTINFNGNNLFITQIGIEAFRNSDIVSVGIPNTVTIIKENAFRNCSIERLSIPESVVTCEKGAFGNCSNLKVIRFEDANSSLCLWGISTYSSPFYGCKNIESVYLGRLEVYSTGKFTYGEHEGSGRLGGLFSSCTELKYVEFGEYAKYIDAFCFSYCSNLVSFEVPSSIESIGWGAFRGCENLKEIKLNEGLKYIEECAFEDCPIKKIIIPSSVTNMEKHVFWNCTELMNVYSKIETPANIHPETFSGKTYLLGTLYVPIGTKEKYLEKTGWKEFSNIVEIENFDIGEDDEEKHICSAPEICIVDGNIVVSSSTENSQCETNIISDDFISTTETIIPLSGIYTISSYAYAIGYKNSETITATLAWVNPTLKDNESANILNMDAKKAVLLKSDSNSITISGTEKNEVIKLYTVDGQLQDTVVANGSEASIGKELTKGNVYVVKIGEKSIKYKF